MVPVGEKNRQTLIYWRKWDKNTFLYTIYGSECAHPAITLPVDEEAIRIHFDCCIGIKSRGLLQYKQIDFKAQ